MQFFFLVSTYYTGVITIKNRLRAVRDSALVNFDDWCPDGLSRCSTALSLFRYRLAVSCFIVRYSAVYSTLLKMEYFQPLFVQQSKKLINYFRYLLLVTFRAFDAFQTSADTQKELCNFYPTHKILMPTCNIWRCYQFSLSRST